jgi:hypothetical protein
MFFYAKNLSEIVIDLKLYIYTFTLLYIHCVEIRFRDTL